MPVHDSAKGIQVSLEERIAQAEYQIKARRVRVRQRMFAFKNDLREQLLSPIALLSYGGIGLIAGIMLGRPQKTVYVGTKRGDAAKTDRLERLFAKTMKIIAFARTLGAFLPSVPSPTPSRVNRCDL